MHPDRDFDPRVELPPEAADLIQDLGLGLLFDAMAAGDAFLRGIAEQAVLRSLQDPREIAYRQEVLQDCLEHRETVLALYGVATEAIEQQRKIHGLYFFARSPELILARSVELLSMLVGMLRRLRSLAEASGGGFRSKGFSAFRASVAAELDEDYIRSVEGRLQELRLDRGVVLSARLGLGGKGRDYVLHEPRRAAAPRLARLLGRGPRMYSFEIADRDEAGHQALQELRGRGLNLVANAVAQSAEHVLSFFTLLRAELGFYVGALNLRAELDAKDEPTAFPVALPAGDLRLSAEGLYDVCLSLVLDGRAVGNDLQADGKELVLVTGANQGGKSTFLRSVGVAQLMMQCGLFVGAQAFSAGVAMLVLTHFPRPEDAAMESGRLDEELRRMSRVTDLARPGAMLLCNESFSSTNEREGSEIGRQVIRAFTEAGVRVLFVTHFYDLAEGLFREGSGRTLFMRAGREPDGRRSFRLAVAGPLPTSYGLDLYREVFGDP
jgi:hypothetical protein